MTPRPEIPSALRRLAVVLTLGVFLASCGAPEPRRSAARSSRTTVASAPRPASAPAVPAPKAAAPAKATTPVAAPKPAAPVVTAAKGADADARFKTALEQMKARQFDDAQASFLALSKDFPAFTGPLTNLGILYAQGRQRDAAVASFSKAVNANPRNAVAFNWLGILYREGGNYAQAQDAYRRALAARADYAPAVLNLAILNDVFLHRPADALAGYRDYQRLTGNRDLIVAAWIRDLESPPVAAPVVTAGLDP